MSKQPLAPPSGSRDFLPREALFRDGVLSRVKAAFALHGFSPIDTPAFERIETLSGKYGEEGEKPPGGAWFFLAGDAQAPMAKRVHDGPIAVRD